MCFFFPIYIVNGLRSGIKSFISFLFVLYVLEQFVKLLEQKRYFVVWSNFLSWVGRSRKIVDWCIICSLSQSHRNISSLFHSYFLPLIFLSMSGILSEMPKCIKKMCSRMKQQVLFTPNCVNLDISLNLSESESLHFKKWRY